MTAPSPSPTPPPSVDQVREVLAAAVVAAVGPLLPAGWVWQPDRFTDALLPAVSALLAEARADGERVRSEVRELMDDWIKAEQTDPHWEICIWVPEQAGEAFHERLFDALADVADDHQHRIAERDWDVFCVSSKGHPSVPVHELDRAIDPARAAIRQTEGNNR